MQFTTNPKPLSDILEDCASGRLQLPDFQRSWVWDEERIKSLIASISQSFPIGALMTLKLKHDDEAFARRPIEGAPSQANGQLPDELILDGQQRMTSLYQTCLRGAVVKTITPRQRIVYRWFYIDMRKALDPAADREEAIFVVPETKLITEDFARRTVLDLTTPQKEYESLCYPVHAVFDWDDWQDGFNDHWNDHEKRALFRRFKDEVLRNFDSYQVPVISLGADTSHEAVCLVFEKVNTGGKALDAFELVTAMYAAGGYRLRDDWFGENGEPGLQARLHAYGHVANQRSGILAGVQSTDVLQAIALLHSKAGRDRARREGRSEAELPAVRATRQSLLDLPLQAYKDHRLSIEQGFKDAAKFLRQQGLYRVYDLPYQSQIVPLAAILTSLGNRWENTENKAKLARWYWCGIFGELYGSATETRFARDVVEVPAWLDGGEEPTTVRDGVLRQNRLRQLRTRQSAAYKGVNALLLREGAEDFRTGQPYDVTIFFDENVDIHHVYPQKWCSEQGVSPALFDTVVNKTPLAARTNRSIGGDAPSRYLARLEKGGSGDPAISTETLDKHLATHALDPHLLRADDFDAFFADREQRLLQLIANATGHKAMTAANSAEDGEAVPNDVARDAGFATGESEPNAAGTDSAVEAA